MWALGTRPPSLARPLLLIRRVTRPVHRAGTSRHDASWVAGAPRAGRARRRMRNFRGPAVSADRYGLVISTW